MKQALLNRIGFIAPVISAVMALLISFGVRIDNVQLGAINALAAVLVALIIGKATEQATTPNSQVAATSDGNVITASHASELRNGTPVELVRVLSD